MAVLDLDKIQNSLPGGNKIPKTPGDLITAILPYIFATAGIALLIYLVTGGLQLMTSRGDPKAIQGAQGKITNALLGFVIVIISFVMVRLLGQLLGISQFSLIFGNVRTIR